MTDHYTWPLLVLSVVNYTVVIQDHRRKVVKVCRNGWTNGRKDHKVS